MVLHFYKYHGCGNDFIILDNRTGAIKLSNQQVQNLCHRHFAIGADGLMLLELEPGYDFKMVYYNSDGNISSLCGNGSRCITAFAQKLGIIKDKARFLAADGEHFSVINGTEIALKMNDVNSIEQHTDFSFLNTGSPHVVKWVNGLDEYDVFTEGRKIRRSEPFNSKGGTNVNFAEPDANGIFIRTYERGVEDETLACGTGVTAAALVAASLNKATSPTLCKVKTPGGDLTVTFQKTPAGFTDIWLRGPAVFVFEGDISI
ncbi:MAG: diaminopimelate epimerase [Bacteroidia bacterium]